MVPQSAPFRQGNAPGQQGLQDHSLAQQKPQTFATNSIVLMVTALMEGSVNFCIFAAHAEDPTRHPAAAASLEIMAQEGEEDPH